MSRIFFQLVIEPTVGDARCDRACETNRQLHDGKKADSLVYQRSFKGYCAAAGLRQLLALAETRWRSLLRFHTRQGRSRDLQPVLSA